MGLPTKLPDWRDGIYGNECLAQTKASWHLPLYHEGRPSRVRNCLFPADHLWWPAPLWTASLPPHDFLWRLLHLSDRSFGSSTNFLIRYAPGRAPERAPRFYAVFVSFVYPWRKPSSTATAERAPGDYKYVSCSWAKGRVYFPSWTTTWPAAKTKILQCVFFPRNDNYSTPNIFPTSTTKMEKAFQKIIY